MSRRSTVMTTALALLFTLSLSPAAAQQPEREQTQRRQQQDQHQMQQQMQQTQRDFQPRLMKADQLIGTSVTNAQGEDLGHIEDLVLDSQHDGISYAVLAFGGFLGLGEDLHAIPWQAFDVRRTGDSDEVKVVLNASKEQLEQAEGFDRHEWPAENEWDDQVHRSYWGYSAMGEDRSAAYGDAGQREAGQRAERTGDRQRTTETVVTRRLSVMLDEDLYHQTGGELKSIGTIQDVLIDLNRGHVAYVIVDPEGLDAFPDDQLAALPWQGLQTRGGRITTAINEQALQQMTFEDGKLAQLENRRTAEQRHQLAQTEPYWTIQEPAGDAATRYGASPADSLKQRDQHQKQQKKQDDPYRR